MLSKRGYDWHGPSYRNVRAAIERFVNIAPEIISDILCSTAETWTVGSVDKLFLTGMSVSLSTF
jgi:hypothetical protein